MIELAITNRSTLAALTVDVMQRITLAIARQQAEHVGPLWRIMPPSVSFYPSGAAVPAGASELAFFDDSDQAGALGYHARSPRGVPYGRVFVRTILANGGTLYVGANSISATASHEANEMAGDEDTNVWCDDENGYEWARELSDAVEDQAYEIDGISVSNFVLPDFFDPSAPRSTTRFDYLSKLTAPFQTSPGGYQIRRDASGKVENVWGARFPEWKRALKSHPASRTARRHAVAT